MCLISLPQVQEVFPADFSELNAVAEYLPLDANSACTPFTGMVCNINACSNGHADKGDLNLCVVVPFGYWDDGELVLYQLGVAVKLQPLDIIIFDSKEMIHFNMPYKGLRGSLVMNTDKTLQGYRTDLNGWKDKNFKTNMFSWTQARTTTMS